MDGQCAPTDGLWVPEWLRRILRMSGQWFPKQAVQFEGWPKALSSGITLTQTGYGTVQGGTSTANLTLGYGTVRGGVAPVAGNLVVWLIYARDNAAQAINDLTGSGWTQDRRYVSASYCSSMLAKVVVAGDISSPPTGVTAPTSGSCAMWVAYSVTGSVSSITVNTHDSEFTDATAPASDTQNSTGVGGSNYAITLAFGSGTDGTIGVNWSGATPDVTYQISNLYGSITDIAFSAELTLGGANITISKNDDGSGNGLASAYIKVS